MKLQIHNDPKSDTLDIGNGQSGGDGQPVTDRLVAYFDANDEVVSITLENATEVMAPLLRDDRDSGQTPPIVEDMPDIDLFGYVKDCDE